MTWNAKTYTVTTTTQEGTRKMNGKKEDALVTRCKVIAETEKAYGLEAYDDDDANREAMRTWTLWVPKSQVQMELNRPLGDTGMVANVVMIPGWLVAQRGLRAGVALTDDLRPDPARPTSRIEREVVAVVEKVEAATWSGKMQDVDNPLVVKAAVERKLLTLDDALAKLRTAYRAARANGDEEAMEMCHECALQLQESAEV